MSKTIVSNEFHRYLIAGLINTAIGYVTFLIALHAFGFSATSSNGISYAAGLLSAYVMNLAFVFKKSKSSADSIFRFLLGFSIAYAINIAVLKISIQGTGLPPEIGQIFAMVAYTVSFYFINKHFVWKK